MHGNMWLCVPCRDVEIKVMEQTKEVGSIIDSSRKIDESIELKTDIFLAKSIPAKELYASIQQDDSIPEDQKDYQFTKVCYDRFQHFQKVVFDTRKSLSDAENELRMWQVNVQTSAGKLRTELREHFKNLDISYEPRKLKTPKPAVQKTSPAKKFSKAEVNEAAKKYNVPAANLQMVATARNMTADEAGKFLSNLLSSGK
jgi:hypothetical protein